MLLKQHVSHAFLGLSPEKKTISYQANFNAMNPVGSGFINNSTLYSYAAGQTQITAITTQALLAEGGSKKAKSDLKKAVALADTTLSYWALIVEAAAMGDEAIIKAAGFTPTAEQSTPSAIFDEITLDYDVQKGTGTIYLKITGMKGARGFINYFTGADMSIVKRVGTGIAPNVPAIVTVHPETHKHILISGLPSGTIVQAVCVVTNTAGTSQMTNIVSIMVP